MSDAPARMIIKIENEHPVDLLDLTGSFAAVAEEYRRYSSEARSRLYVDRITEGSIVASLVSHTKEVIASGAPLVPVALDGVAPFAGHWAGLLTALATYGRSALGDKAAKAADSSSLKNAKRFVAPAMNGNSITVSGDNNQVAINQFVINPSVAGDITRAANHLLGMPLAAEDRFENEPLKLYQMRDARAGDLGYIDRFGVKPRRLTFASEAVKQEMLHGEASPFDVIFFVSGKAKTAGGEIACYHIDKIDGVTDRDAA